MEYQMNSLPTVDRSLHHLRWDNFLKHGECITDFHLSPSRIVIAVLRSVWRQLRDLSRTTLVNMANWKRMDYREQYYNIAILRIEIQTISSDVLVWTSDQRLYNDTSGAISTTWYMPWHSVFGSILTFLLYQMKFLLNQEIQTYRFRHRLGLCQTMYIRRHLLGTLRHRQIHLMLWVLTDQ